LLQAATHGKAKKSSGKNPVAVAIHSSSLKPARGAKQRQHGISWSIASPYRARTSNVKSPPVTTGEHNNIADAMSATTSSKIWKAVCSGLKKHSGESNKKKQLQKRL